MEHSEPLYTDTEEFNKTIVGEGLIDLRHNNDDPSFRICYYPYKAIHPEGYFLDQNGTFI